MVLNYNDRLHMGTSSNLKSPGSVDKEVFVKGCIGRSHQGCRERPCILNNTKKLLCGARILMVGDFSMQYVLRTCMVPSCPYTWVWPLSPAHGIMQIVCQLHTVSKQNAARCPRATWKSSSKFHCSPSEHQRHNGPKWERSPSQACNPRPFCIH